MVTPRLCSGFHTHAHTLTHIWNTHSHWCPTVKKPRLPHACRSLPVPTLLSGSLHVTCPIPLVSSFVVLVCIVFRFSRYFLLVLFEVACIWPEPPKCSQLSGVWSLQDTSPEGLLASPVKRTAVCSFGNVRCLSFGVLPSDLTIHQQVWLTTEERPLCSFAKADSVGFSSVLTFVYFCPDFSSFGQ